MVKRKMSPLQSRACYHNGLFGDVGMIEACARRIEDSDTTTETAKRIAASIRQDAMALQRELKTRVD